MTVVRDILIRAVKLAFNVPSDRIQNDVLKFALEAYNHYGQLIWNEWKWDNAKRTAEDYTPDSDGIITLDSSVESVRAVYIGNAQGNEPVSAYDDVLAVGGAAPQLTEETFEYLADDASGNRRIKVTDAKATYTVLSLKRFVEATIEDDYDSGNPTATPTDYRVAKWALDRAKPAIVAYISDSLKSMRGEAPAGQGVVALQQAVEREEQMQQKDHRVVPSHPGYGEIGNWY